MSDLGSYKCVANNKAGEALSISSLTIEPAEQSFSKARETQSIYSPRIEPAEQSFNKAREIQSIYSPRIEPAEQSFNKTREIQSIYSPRIEPAEQSFNKTREIQSIYSPRIEPAEQSFNKTRETQSIYSPRIEPAEQSFICHLKDTEPSDEEDSIEAEAKGNEMPPAFIKPLTKKKIYEGNTLMFMTEVIGCPIPDVKWYKNKSLLEPDHRIRLEREGNLCTLVIDSVHKEDEGEYICHVVNIIGEAKSSGQLIVLDKPHFTRSLQAVKTVVNSNVRLECQVDEDTGVKVAWKKDEETLRPGKDYRMTFEDKVAVLEILKSRLKDSGNYMCTASNEAGSTFYRLSLGEGGWVEIRIFLREGWL
uniref:Ig-like domain-containing protein n=1 Tax=Callorhinchus milii TaxID=7868 RepID=A0A4W3IYT0_CALMI